MAQPVSSSGRASYGGVYCGGGATKATGRKCLSVANMPVGYANTRIATAQCLTSHERETIFPPAVIFFAQRELERLI